MKQWPDNLSLLEKGSPAAKAKVDPTLRLAPKETSCLDPGKKSYTVKELEAAIGCKDLYTAKLKSRFYSLAKATEELEK